MYATSHFSSFIIENWLLICAFQFTWCFRLVNRGMALLPKNSLSAGFDTYFRSCLWDEPWSSPAGKGEYATYSCVISNNTHMFLPLAVRMFFSWAMSLFHNFTWTTRSRTLREARLPRVKPETKRRHSESLQTHRIFRSFTRVLSILLFSRGYNMPSEEHVTSTCLMLTFNETTKRSKWAKNWLDFWKYSLVHMLTGWCKCRRTDEGT